MATYPVPGAAYRDFEIEYAVLADGRVWSYYPETDDFAPLTLAEYEQYEAIYPDAPKMPAEFFLNDDNESVANSAFISNPDEDASLEDDNDIIPPLPFVRLANPDPTDEENEAKNHNHVLSEAITTSPYRHCSTPNTGAGIELTPWGEHFFIDETSHLGVYVTWEADSGIRHGHLQKCGFAGWLDRAGANQPDPAVAPELKLTTPEGGEIWLDDCLREPEYEYEFVYAEGTYSHRCDNRCFAFFEAFGWELFPGFEPASSAIDDEEDEEMQMRMIEAECEEAREREVMRHSGLQQLMDEEEKKNGVWEDPAIIKKGPVIAQEPEVAPKKKRQHREKHRSSLVLPTVLETIFEEDADVEHTTAAAAQDDDESVFEPVNEDLLDRLADAVFGECERREAAAVKDAEQQETEQQETEQQEIEEQEAEVQETEVQETEQEVDETGISFWDRDPFYVSGANWADMVDEEED